MFTMRIPNRLTAGLRSGDGRRILTWLLLAGLYLALPAPPAVALEPRPHCLLCRRFSDTSAARFQAYLKVGNHTKVIDACSLFCLIEQLEDCNREPDWIYAVNYATREDPDTLPLIASRAFYIYDASAGDEEKTAKPFTYAFASEAQAKDYLAELGGEVLDWTAAVERVTKLTDEWEPQDPSGLRPNPNRRHDK